MRSDACCSAMPPVPDAVCPRSMMEMEFSRAVCADPSHLGRCLSDDPACLLLKQIHPTLWFRQISTNGGFRAKAAIECWCDGFGPAVKRWS